jgi:NADH-quinone oxidoreductase subunit E
MEESLRAIFSCYKGEANELIPILQHVQEEFGYLPEQAISEIARFIGVPENRVYSVATFYTQFRFAPMGKNHVMVCRGTACHVKGAPRILDELENQLGIKEGETTPDMAFSLETVACIGACGAAPTMMINEDTYGQLTAKKISEILAEVRSEGKGEQDGK